MNRFKEELITELDRRFTERGSEGGRVRDMRVPLYVVDFVRQEVPKRAPGSVTLIGVGHPDTWVTVDPGDGVPAGLEVVAKVAYDFREGQTVITRG